MLNNNNNNNNQTSCWSAWQLQRHSPNSWRLPGLYLQVLAMIMVMIIIMTIMMLMIIVTLMMVMIKFATANTYTFRITITIRRLSKILPKRFQKVMSRNYSSYLSPMSPKYGWRKNGSCGGISDFNTWDMEKSEIS